VTLEQRDGEALFVVSDGGRGIQPSELESIFEPFTQVGTPGAGLGIGLSLVKNLVELHGGSIRAQSEGAGTGATFSIRIPLEVHPGEQGRRAAPAREGAPATSEPTRLPDGARILIIDDVRDSADMLALLLRESGAEVACAYTAAEGLARASEWSPEAVLVDIGLPDMTGYEVAVRLRADHPRHTLLLAVTGFGDVGAETRASAAGFDGKLLKPVDLDSLLGILRRRLVQTRD
jgi:CheY-like chemotaxis protein